jgi:hypothetical protein
VNLENGAEESKMTESQARFLDTEEREKRAFSLEDLDSGKVAINPGWLAARAVLMRQHD